MPTTLLFPIGFTEKKKRRRPKNWKNGLASHSVKNTRFYPYSKGLYFQKIRQNGKPHRKYVSDLLHNLISRNFCKEMVTKYCNFHIVCCLSTTKEYHSTLKVVACLRIDFTKNPCKIFDLTVWLISTNERKVVIGLKLILKARSWKTTQWRINKYNQVIVSLVLIITIYFWLSKEHYWTYFAVFPTFWYFEVQIVPFNW